MKCWNCGHPVTYSDKIPFRGICDHCHFWQHCCTNCKFYQKGLSNDCAIPGTDPISDREACNFCESFSPKEGSSLPMLSQEEKKKRFDDLFT